MLQPYSTTGGLIYKADSGRNTLTDIAHTFQTYQSGYLDRLSILVNGNVGIGTTTPTAGYRLDVTDTTGTGIRISDTTNVSSLRTQWSNATGTVTAAANGSVSTSITFNTQTAAGSTTNTLSLDTGTVGIRGASNSVYPLTITRFVGSSGNIPVSYTHLTLPTKRIV